MTSLWNRNTHNDSWTVSGVGHFIYDLGDESLKVVIDEVLPNRRAHQVKRFVQVYLTVIQQLWSRCSLTMRRQQPSQST
jgi:hypothetical protein